MPRVHDLRCRECGAVETGVWCEGEGYPACSCGGQRTWLPFVFKTDVYGTPMFCEASGESHSSAHDRDRYMRQRGYEPCGDPVGGARNVLKVEGTVFSYPGQPSRATREKPDPRAPVRR